MNTETDEEVKWREAALAEASKDIVTESCLCRSVTLSPKVIRRTRLDTFRHFFAVTNEGSAVRSTTSFSPPGRLSTCLPQDFQKRRCSAERRRSKHPLLDRIKWLCTAVSSNIPLAKDELGNSHFLQLLREASGSTTSSSMIQDILLHAALLGLNDFLDEGYFDIWRQDLVRLGQLVTFLLYFHKNLLQFCRSHGFQTIVLDPAKELLSDFGSEASTHVAIGSCLLTLSDVMNGAISDTWLSIGCLAAVALRSKLSQRKMDNVVREEISTD